MPVKHTIRKDGKENTKTVRLTFRTAIRAFCLECVGFSASEVKLCAAPLCPLFPFRHGNDPGLKGTRKGRSKEEMAEARKFRKDIRGE